MSSKKATKNKGHVKSMTASVDAVTDTTLSVSEAWRRTLGQGGKYFKVVFRLKNDAKDGSGRKAGTIREMTCRLEVHRYKNRVTGLGEVIPDEVRWEEDVRCKVLTCWDVLKYHELRRQGLGVVTAGRRAYRRINLAEVISVEPWEKP